MNRYKRLQLSPDIILGCLTEGIHSLNYSVAKDAVPLDAVLVNVNHAYPNGIEILLYSETFPALSEGDLIPLLETTVVDLTNGHKTER